MDEGKNKKIHDVKDWLVKEYAGIRTGQAAPALLDSIKVEQYGAKVPVNQVGSVGVEDARTLRVSTWDAGVIPAVEKAIREADLGVSVSTDSAGLRVIFPELTSERRVQLVKLAKQKLEEARVSIRSIRDDCMKELDNKQKSGDISEDEKFTEKEKVQKIVDSANKELEDLFSKKESEISV
ncbi:ribosome recycling factor [Candidatus Kaiserbacteria bacterium]|nr:ribosome recycling factor [Candidatus Kaiserbacteria bacterium]